MFCFSLHNASQSPFAHLAAININNCTPYGISKFVLGSLPSNSANTLLLLSFENVVTSAALSTVSIFWTAGTLLNEESFWTTFQIFLYALLLERKKGKYWYVFLSCRPHLCATFYRFERILFCSKGLCACVSAQQPMTPEPSSLVFNSQITEMIHHAMFSPSMCK